MINQKTCGTCGMTFDAGAMGFSWDCPNCKVREETERTAERRHRESERSAAERHEQTERAAAKRHEELVGTGSPHISADSSHVSAGSSYTGSLTPAEAAAGEDTTSNIIGWGGCLGPVVGVVSWLIVWFVGGVAFTTFDKASKVGSTVGITIWLLFLITCMWRVIRQERLLGRTNHGAHAFMTLVTVGTWLPVWICLTVFRKRR